MIDTQPISPHSPSSLLPTMMDQKFKVLVVDDEPDILEFLHYNLSRSGFTTVQATNGKDAIKLADAEIPDLILLDLSFPRESGFEVLRYWKSNAKLHQIPVVVWTVMGETEKKLCHFFGVEHVVPKWAGPKELETALKNFVQDSNRAQT